MIKPIDSGGLMLSYKCNCRCRHCLYASSPKWKDWMDVSDAGRIFEGLLEFGSLRGFHIAGGEPFLDFPRLVRVMRLATEFGVPIEYVETNAHWCTDPETTREKLSCLRDAGLSCLLVSCSPFHAERIPLSRLETAVKIGYEVFGPNGVILWVPEFYRELASVDTEATVSLERYVEVVGKSNMRYMVRDGYSLITGGRVGYELADWYERRPAERCEGEHCRMELLASGHAHFDPYGNLIPSFCSGISLGDGRDLPTLMREFSLARLPIVRILAEEGPYALYKMAARRFRYKANPAGYIGKCHLCTDVRRHIVSLTDEFAELTPAQFYKEL
ncbi:MAG: radical SAM protein [Armatimonadota bacterium]